MMVLALKCSSCGACFTAADAPSAPRECAFCGDHLVREDPPVPAAPDPIAPYPGPPPAPTATSEEDRASWRQGRTSLARDRFEIQRFGGGRAILWSSLILFSILIPRVEADGRVLTGWRVLFESSAESHVRTVVTLTMLAGLLGVIVGMLTSGALRGVFLLVLGSAPFVVQQALAPTAVTPWPLVAILAAFGVYVCALATAAQMARSVTARVSHLLGGVLMLFGVLVAMTLRDPTGTADLRSPQLTVPIACIGVAVVISFLSSLSDQISHRMTWIARFLCGCAVALYFLGRISNPDAGDPFYETGMLLQWGGLLFLATTGLADIVLGITSESEAVRERENFGRMLGYLERFNTDAKFGKGQSGGTPGL